MKFEKLSNKGLGVLKFSEDMIDQETGFNISILPQHMNLSFDLSDETSYMLKLMHNTQRNSSIQF